MEHYQKTLEQLKQDIGFEKARLITKMYLCDPELCDNPIIKDSTLVKDYINKYGIETVQKLRKNGYKKTPFKVSESFTLYI